MDHETKHGPLNLDLLMKVLAVPTQTHCEDQMVRWLLAYFAAKGIHAECDELGNVYATKGTLQPGEHYPCVIAHTDTVHWPRPVDIYLQDDRLLAMDEDGLQAGTGGDNKAGIFIGLELFARHEVIKGAFFVSEEVGCIGSRGCRREFFADVGYAMMFDSPCDDIVSYSCAGYRLFPDEGPFVEKFLPLLDRFGMTNWQHHPYTDAGMIKSMFDFPCPNLPGGYFRFHTREEYVVPEAVAASIELGDAAISALGRTKYVFAATQEDGHPQHPVGGLRTHDWPQLRKATTTL
jgi:hypothetical protein